MTVSDEPGLGYEYNWKQLDETCLTKVEVKERLTPIAKLVPWH